jgi:hypothetical protein
MSASAQVQERVLERSEERVFKDETLVGEISREQRFIAHCAREKTNVLFFTPSLPSIVHC